MWEGENGLDKQAEWQDNEEGFVPILRLKSVLNENRPRPTALKDNMRRLGRVGRFTPNPALPTDQPLRGRWRNATSKCIGRYKFVVLPNPYIIKRDWDETRYVLRKIKMQEDTKRPTATR